MGLSGKSARIRLRVKDEREARWRDEVKLEAEDRIA